MAQTFDIVVLGLGANGSSAIYQLSKTGHKVAGIDQFTPPHEFGSSHGQSRIIRQAYFESPLYVPFLIDAYQYWNEIEKASDAKLFIKTGGLMIGREDSSLVKGSLLSARTHGLPHEIIDNKEIQRRFPAFKPKADDVALLENDAGILLPESCIRAFLTEAQRNNATLFFNERVLNIEERSDDLIIITDKGVYHTSKLVVSAGAWLDGLMPALRLPLAIKRQVLFWFQHEGGISRKFIQPEALPIYIWEYEPSKMFYGFPDLGDGIKIAIHHQGEKITPMTLKQDVRNAEIQQMTEITKEYLNLDLSFNFAKACMYTNTPDENFIIDFHPENPNIIIASPCSGHGFKFASVTGKILADMATGKEIGLDISPFSIRRFS